MPDNYEPIKHAVHSKVVDYVSFLKRHGIDAKVGISPFWGYSNVYVRRSEMHKAQAMLGKLLG